MPTDEIKQFQRFFDIKKQGGAVSLLSVLTGTILLYLRLSPEQIAHLKQGWSIIILPPVLTLLYLAGKATKQMFLLYITEIQARTKVEEEIQGNLSTLIENFKILFNRFDESDKHLRNIYAAMEKRGDYKPGQDTERFLNNAGTH